MANAQVKWPTMFNNEHGSTPLDYSNQFEDVFEEIPPFTKNEKGEWLNETSEPKIIKTGKINIQEKIDSYADDVDIYKILARVAASGDDSILCEAQGVYGDFSAVPTNINDFDNYVAENIETIKSLPKEISSLILKDDFNQEELDEAIKKYNEKNKNDTLKKEVEKKDE